MREEPRQTVYFVDFRGGASDKRVLGQARWWFGGAPTAAVGWCKSTEAADAAAAAVAGGAGVSRSSVARFCFLRVRVTGFVASDSGAAAAAAVVGGGGSIERLCWLERRVALR